MRFHKSRTCGCTAFIQMFFFDASRKQCFRGISYRPRAAPKAWQEWMPCSTGEQQRRNDSAAVSCGREARGELQSVPEQIALRKMIFPLFPAFVPATQERVSESKPSIAGRRSTRRRGLHPLATATCWRVHGSGGDNGLLPAGAVESRGGPWLPPGVRAWLHPRAWQTRPAFPTLLSISEHLALLQGLFCFKE